jgi:hypothetical protein
MPRLPDANQLPTRAFQPSSGSISVKTPDYGAVARGAEALSSGVDAISRGFQANLKAEEEIDDYETRKNILDFRLKTEMELEEMKRDMPAGGAGWTDAWSKHFAKRAAEFVGRDDRNIPMTQRAKVGLILKQHETGLAERAQRYELAERDRQHVDSLETQLGTLRDVVGTNPARRDEMFDEGRKQIELSRIPQPDKHRLLKKYDKTLDQTQATARILGMSNVEDREAFRKELRLDQEDAPVGSNAHSVLTSGVAKGKPAGWAASDPTWAKLSQYERAAAMALMEADGMDPQAARNALGAMINRAAKNGEDLGAHVSQKIYQPTIEPAQQQRLSKILNSKAFSDLTSWAARRAKGEEPDPVQGATHFLASEKTMLALEAKEPQKYRSWRKWTGFDGTEYKGVITRDGSHAFLAPEGARTEDGVATVEDPNAPRKPYSNLTLMERREIWNKADTEWKKKIGEADTLIKHMRERAVNGELPPDVEINAIAERVKKYGDEGLASRFSSMVGLADTINRIHNNPPAAGEAYVRQVRAAISDAQGGRMTEEQMTTLKAMEKAVEVNRKNTNEDAFGWAAKRGMEVPTGEPVAPGATDELGQPMAQPTRRIVAKPIDFNPANKTLDVDLADRFNSARDLARYQGQPIQVFTKGDRDALRDFIGRGGPPMIYVLSKIVEHGGDDALDAIQEFSKDAPEALMIGKLVQEGGDPYLINTAAAEIQKRAKDGEKYINKVDKKLAEPDVAALMPALQMTPGMVDPVQHMTNLLYNFEHRRQGKDQFDSKLYVDTMRKVLGERKDAKGNVYGGIGTQGGSWGFDGKWSSYVQVPGEIKQNSFDEMVNAIRVEDFNGNMPVDDEKKPLSLREIQTATWRSLGNGRYGLMMGTSANGREQFALDVNGRPYVLDVKPMLGNIRTRKPEIFDVSGQMMRLSENQDGGDFEQLGSVMAGIDGLASYTPGPVQSDNIQDRRKQDADGVYDSSWTRSQQKLPRAENAPREFQNIIPRLN